MTEHGAEHDIGRMPIDHFVFAIAPNLTIRDDGSVAGLATVRPEWFAPGTSRIRTGVLVTLLDIVAGHVPVGAINPTVDMRLTITGPIPTAGEISIFGCPLRVGKRLVISETTFTDDAGNEFARGVATFINVPVGSDILLKIGPKAPVAEGSIDGLLGARQRDEVSIEVDPVQRISNGPSGTVQGGAQALLAELAAEHVAGRRGRVDAVDLEIRYLDRVQVGPLVATAEVLGAANPASARQLVRVLLTDAGNNDRLVSYVTIGVEPTA